MCVLMMFLCVLVASHVLHELEAICESFLLICDGRLLASGSAYEVHSLLANIPNRIRFKSNQPKEMAVQLLEKRLVQTIDVDEAAGQLTVTTSQPADLYEQIPILSEQGIEILEMHSGDDSLQAAFDSLLSIHRGEI